MKIAICDDIKKDRDVIFHYLKKLETFDERFIIDQYEDGYNLIEAYSNGERYDLLLLDIQMRKIDGFDTADWIREKDQNAIIAFMTTRSEYISKAFFVEASAFLIKPVKEDNVLNLLMHTIKRMNERNQEKIMLSINREIRYISPADVMYIETSSNRTLCYIMVNDSELNVYKSMKEAIHEMASFSFIYLTRSCIVNPRYIAGFDTSTKSIILLNHKRLYANTKDMNRIYQEYTTYLAQKAQNQMEHKHTFS